MDSFPWEIVLPVIGIGISVAAFVWEFAVVGRKQLGYRVQLDTPVTTGPDSGQAGSFPYADVLGLLGRKNEPPLLNPSLVLVRIENSGTTHIGKDDYAVADDTVGMHIEFPRRRVVGMAATEFSDSFIAGNFGEGSGFAKRVTGKGESAVGVIELPRTPLNRGAHFKVLALLERTDRTRTRRGDLDPRAIGGITGGVGNGGIRRTKARVGLSWRIVAMICVLAVALVELGRALFFGPAPLDCATGQLTLVGSTAFQPVVEEAADLYAGSCPGAGFIREFAGSDQGLRRLNDERSLDMLAFSDGEKRDGLPQLLPRPAAFSLFTLVANREAGVQDLSTDQILRLYDGRITNWREIGGNDQPVRLVGRQPDSGTRATFQQQVLGGRWEPETNSIDCLTTDSGARPGVVRCQRSSTTDLLNTVASTPGALGYSELGAVSAREDLLPVRIDGHEATLDGAVHQAYPFWQTEYAYTYGQPEATSLAASFLRYLTHDVGTDIVRSHGLLPCTELENPVLCRP